MRDVWIIFFLSSLLAFIVPGALYIAAFSGVLVMIHLAIIAFSMLFPG